MEEVPNKGVVDRGKFLRELCDSFACNATGLR